MQHTIRLFVLVMCAFTLTACGGCGADDAEGESVDETEQTSEGEASSSDADMAKNREAYGLPMPPQVLSVRREPDKTVVMTDMTLEEVTSFYESRLQDYEILRPGRKIRVLGLRDYMPEISGRKFGGNVELHYWPNKLGGSDRAEAEEGEGDEAGDDQEGASASAQKFKPIHKRKRGEPVRDRTADGELVAPGARWGEPYTPPPGTPLDQKRFESNFGKPYGTWVHQ